MGYLLIHVSAAIGTKHRGQIVLVSTVNTDGSALLDRRRRGFLPVFSIEVIPLTAAGPNGPTFSVYILQSKLPELVFIFLLGDFLLLEFLAEQVEFSLNIFKILFHFFDLLYSNNFDQSRLIKKRTGVFVFN